MPWLRKPSVSASAASLAVFASFVTLILAHPCAAQHYDVNARDRLAREAVDLFKALDRNPVDIGRCTFERAWDGWPVLAETAQKHFGLTVRADLVVSDPPAIPALVIDPANDQPDAFCSPAEREAVRKEGLAVFQKGRGAVLRFISVRYSFPVFNADYTRAALVVQRHMDSYMRMPDGTLRPSIEAAGGAEIYQRRGGVWNRIDYDSYYTAH